MSTVRLVLTGDPLSGKSSILHRYNDDVFSSEKVAKSSSGVDYITRELRIVDTQVSSSSTTASSTIVNLQIWDFAGDEGFRSTNKLILSRAQGVMIVFDITDNRAIDRLEHKIHNIRRIASVDSSIILCAAKVDLLLGDFEEIACSNKSIERFTKEMHPSVRKAEALRERFNIDLYLTSAATGENIDRVFFEIATKIYEKQVQERDDCFLGRRSEYKINGSSRSNNTIPLSTLKTGFSSLTATTSSSSSPCSTD